MLHTGSTNSGDGKYIFTGTDREQYTKGVLELSDIDQESPFPTFRQWFDQAKAEGVTADAVCLSTAELPTGRISSRMVLLKELDKKGFVIYSNFGTSRKSQDLETNQRASLCFWYEKMERSVRVEGRTQRLTDADSQVYFGTRPVGSRIGAWASPQSTVIQARSQLDDFVRDVGERFNVPAQKEADAPAPAEAREQHIPVPPFWGGLRIVPERVEFWSGRNNRLHDRLVYTLCEPTADTTSIHDKSDTKDEMPAWKIERLAP